MMLRRNGLPEEGELLLCEVKKVHYHSVFVYILEYGIEGMIHSSEIAPGRIRNIRDYVREGKFVVCKVLRVDLQKRHVDLSLRRVTERERIEKNNQISQEKRAEKIVEHIANEFKLEPRVLYEKIACVLLKDYDYLYDAFLEFSKGKLKLANIDIPEKIRARLEEEIKENIKPPMAVIKGHLKISTYDPEGVKLIRRAFKETNKKHGNSVKLRYEGGGTYYLQITADDYEKCEKILKNYLNSLQGFFTNQNNTFEFQRVS